MIDFLRHLIAAPLKILLWLCRFVPIFSQLSLAEKIFFLTNDADDGIMVIWLINKTMGIEQVRTKAKAVLEKCPSARITYMIAMFEMHQNPDCVAAEKWVASAKQNNYIDRHFLYQLELYFGDCLEDYDSDQILDEMLACNYLPPDHTYSALLLKKEMLVGEHQWAEAEEIADRMLSIKEDPNARITKWLVCRVRKDYAQADEHLAAASQKLPEDDLNIFAVEGCLHLGDEQGAMEYLYRSVKKGLKLERMLSDDSEVDRLLDSERFRDYCAERD